MYKNGNGVYHQNGHTQYKIEESNNEYNPRSMAEHLENIGKGSATSSMLSQEKHDQLKLLEERELLAEKKQIKPFSPENGEIYKYCESDLIVFSPLFAPEVAWPQMNLLIHFSISHIHNLRIGGSVENLARIMRVGEKQGGDLIRAMIDRDIHCKFSDCSFSCKILTVNEEAIPHRRSRSFYPTFLEYVYHIRREHFNKITSEEFNKFLDKHIESLTSPKQRQTRKKNFVSFR